MSFFNAVFGGAIDGANAAMGQWGYDGGDSQMSRTTSKTDNAAALSMSVTCEPQNTGNGDKDGSDDAGRSADSGSGNGSSMASDACGKFCDYLQDKMNGVVPFSGDAARAISNTPQAQAVVEGVAETVANVLQTIGEELSQDQP